MSGRDKGALTRQSWYRRALGFARPSGNVPVVAASDDQPPGGLRTLTDAELLERVRDMLVLVNGQSQPNHGNALWHALRDLEAIKLNVKHFGYEVLQKAADALPAGRGLSPVGVGLPWKASTQADIESDWVAYWASELKVPVVYNRKLWEFAYVLQAIHDAGLMQEGSRGLGFGCGLEPHPSYIASRGVGVTVTDLPSEDQASKGWADTQQHASSLDAAFKGHLVEREAFDRLVDFRFADMNAIPPTLRGYDFCWSMCALEHLGSIEAGLTFIVNSLETLRPGGLAVHTTEFNFLHDDYTIDNWGTVLFQRRHFIELARRLEDAGHEVRPLDFDVGAGPVDKFIDIAPFGHNYPEPQRSMTGWHYGSHLKVSSDGIPTTCFGVIVRKATA